MKPIKTSLLFVFLVCSFLKFAHADSLNTQTRDTILCLGDSVLLVSNLVGQQYEWYYMDTLIANTPTVYAKNIGMYNNVVKDSVGLSLFDSVLVKKGEEANSSFMVGSLLSVLEYQFQAVILGGLIYSWDFGDPGSNANTSQFASPTHLFSSTGFLL